MMEAPVETMDQNGKRTQLWHWPKLAKTPPQNFECWKINHLPCEIMAIIWLVATILLWHLWNKKKVQCSPLEEVPEEVKESPKDPERKENDVISLLENVDCDSAGSMSTTRARWSTWTKHWTVCNRFITGGLAYWGPPDCSAFTIQTWWLLQWARRNAKNAYILAMK